MPTIFTDVRCGDNFVIQFVDNIFIEAYMWLPAAVLLTSITMAALRKLQATTQSRDDLVVLQKSLLWSILFCGSIAFPTFFAASFTRSCLWLRVAYFMGWFCISLTQLGWVAIAVNLWYRIKRYVTYFNEPVDLRYIKAVVCTIMAWIIGTAMSSVQTSIMTPNFMSIIYVILYIIGLYMHLSVYRTSRGMIANTATEHSTGARTVLKRAKALVTIFLITDFLTFLPLTVFSYLKHNLEDNPVPAEIGYKAFSMLVFLHNIPVPLIYVLSKNSCCVCCRCYQATEADHASLLCCTSQPGTSVSGEGVENQARQSTYQNQTLPSRWPVKNHVRIIITQEDEGLNYSEMGNSSKVHRFEATTTYSLHESPYRRPLTTRSPRMENKDDQARIESETAT